MEDDTELETIIEETINGAISTIPEYMAEIRENKKSFQVENPEEFVYGLVMGMALGMGSAMLTAQKGVPTIEDQTKIKDVIYRRIPEIREHIFK